MTFDAWDSYFYPPPDSATMRNRLNERDPGMLQAKEYGRATERQRELMTGEVVLPATFDAGHLKAIHKHLLQDVYEWAGQYRTVNMSKGLSAFAQTSEIDRYLSDGARTIRETDWSTLDRDGFARAAATTFAYINQAHPFREGNGRASKVFMHQVAELGPWRIDFDPAVSGITPELWNQASMLSGPDIGAYEPVPDSLVPVFHALAQPRSVPAAEPVQSEAERDMMLVRAAYPRPASEALNPNASPGTGERNNIVRGIGPVDRGTGRGE